MVDRELVFLDEGATVSHYVTYTPAEQEARRQLIELIEFEKRAYLERIEPYVKRLAAITGVPHLVVQRSSKNGG